MDLLSSDGEMMSSSWGLVLDIITLLLSIVAIGVSLWARRAATYSRYGGLNKEIRDRYHLIGPFTPYGGNEVDEEVEIRIHLLDRLNRFKYTCMPWDHLRFRADTMGNSLTEFRNIVRANGGEKIADLAVKVLVDIKEKEPYFGDWFWWIFFCGYDWNRPGESVIE